MSALLDLLRWIRYSQASMSVAYHNAAVDRAKRGLALALAARDAALAEIHIAGISLQPAEDKEPPAFLLRESQQ